MKLMNEIESSGGEVVKIYLDNGEPVEFGQSRLVFVPSRTPDGLPILISAALAKSLNRTNSKRLPISWQGNV
jgi:hypothetical protein